MYAKSARFVTREPRAGFTDCVEYEANEQNTSYLAFIHENVAKQTKLSFGIFEM